MKPTLIVEDYEEGVKNRKLSVSFSQEGVSKNVVEQDAPSVSEGSCSESEDEAEATVETANNITKFVAGVTDSLTRISAVARESIRKQSIVGSTSSGLDPPKSLAPSSQHYVSLKNSEIIEEANPKKAADKESFYSLPMGSVREELRSRRSIAGSSGSAFDKNGKELNEANSTKMVKMTWSFLALLVNILLIFLLKSLNSTEGFQANFGSSSINRAGSALVQIFVFLI
jgi:hypothetical protein